MHCQLIADSRIALRNLTLYCSVPTFPALHFIMVLHFPALQFSSSIFQLFWCVLVPHFLVLQFQSTLSLDRWKQWFVLC